MARGRAVGIKDVAREAGVSITAVSHALSGKGRLPEETRARVRQVAAALGYTPNAAARSLAGGMTGLLSTYVSLPGDAPLAFTEIDYYVELIDAAVAAAVERGYALVVAPTTAGEETWARLPLDGVIVIDPAEGDPSLAAVRDRGVSLVLIGRDLHGRPDDVVVENDREAGTRSVLDHLVERGARHVGLASYATYESFTEDAQAAYRGWYHERVQEPLRRDGRARVGPPATTACERRPRRSCARQTAPTRSSASTSGWGSSCSGRRRSTTSPSPTTCGWPPSPRWVWPRPSSPRSPRSRSTPPSWGRRRPTC